MKNSIKTLLSIILIPLLFTSCITKMERDHEDINKKSNSELIELLIKKERELNDLKASIENCNEHKIDD